MTDILMLIVIGLSAVLIVLVLGVTAASFWRRKDPLPPDMFDGDLPEGPVYPGRHEGTRRAPGGKRFDAQGFLSPGKGRFYADDRGVSFLIDQSNQPIHLPYARVDAVRSERTTLVVSWSLEGRGYESTFILDSAPPAEIVSHIQNHLKRRQGA